MPELEERLRDFVESGAPPVTWEEVIERRAPRRLPRARQHRFGVAELATGAAVAAAVVLVVVLALSGVFGDRGAGRQTTKRPPSPPRWTLVGYLASGWAQTPGTPTAGGLVCPDSQNCYVTVPTAEPRSGVQSLVDGVYASHDGGVTWKGPLHTPNGDSFTSTLSCSSTTDCSAGGLDGGGHNPVLLETADGGQSWRVEPLPRLVGTIKSLSCRVAGACYALANASRGASASGFGAYAQYGASADPTTLLATADGGQTWATHAFPPDDTMTLLACSPGGACVVAGGQLVIGTDGSSGWSGTVMFSDDRGRNWKVGSWPYSGSVPSALSCPAAMDCFALGTAIGSGAVPVTTTTLSCTAAPCPIITAPDFTTQVLRSSDLGRHWSIGSLPSAPPGIQAQQLSCPNTTECWISGSDSEGFTVIGPNGGGVGSSRSPFVLRTEDSGHTWISIPPPTAISPPYPGFPAPSGPQAAAPQFFDALQCPEPGHCIAVAGPPPGKALVFLWGSEIAARP